LIVLERVFRQRISRQQQDAHEFLQVVAETLAEENHKQRKLEREQRSGIRKESIEEVLDDTSFGEVVIVSAPGRGPPHSDEEPEAEFVGMPLEGRLKSEIECQTCRFKPKPTLSTFVVLTLPVPQKVCYLTT
jgi:ubiquitin carboxyl-terminal hydrolase 16